MDAAADDRLCRPVENCSHRRIHLLHHGLVVDLPEALVSSGQNRLQAFAVFVQRLVGPFQLGHVTEDHDSADDTPALAHRDAGVINVEARAILAPQHFVVDLHGRPFVVSQVHGAVLRRIGAPVGARMVDQLVHGLAEELGGGITQHFGCCRVHEGQPARCIDAENSLARGIQQ